MAYTAKKQKDAKDCKSCQRTADNKFKNPKKSNNTMFRNIVLSFFLIFDGRTIIRDQWPLLVFVFHEVTWTTFGWDQKRLLNLWDSEAGGTS